MQGTNSSNVATHARGNPYAPNRPPQDASRPDPMQTLKAWTSRLENIGLDEREMVLAFLKNVAMGETGGEKVAQPVFNDLIAHHAYDVFAEVFNTYNAIQKAHAEANGLSFKATLMLWLPRDWAPSSPVALDAAFGAIEVQHVFVRRPRSALEDVEGIRRPTVAQTMSQTAWNIPISKAICHAVATLLKGGASKLAVCGVLEDVEVVTREIEASTRFEALELGESRHTPPYTSLEGQCYETLILTRGIGHKLKSLTIHASEFLGRLQDRMAFDPPHWPALTSVRVTSGPLDSAAHIEWFVRTIAQCQQLAELSLAFDDGAMAQGMQRIFDVLKSHGALRKMELKGYVHAHGQDHCLRFLPMVIQLARSCPTLTHFKWDAIDDLSFRAGEVMNRDFLFARELLDELVEEIAQAMMDPNFKLEFLSMLGFALPAGVTRAFFDGLVRNKTLKHIDFSGCAIELRSTINLLMALKENTTLLSCVLPKDPEAYYLLMQHINGYIQGFESKRRDWAIADAGHTAAGGQQPQRDEFQLLLSASAPHLADELATLFDDALKAHADTFLDQLAAHLYANQRLAGFPELVTEVQNVFKGTGLDHRDMAQRITEKLEAYGALRSVVHLSEVSTSASLSDRRQKVKPFVKLHNALAGAKNLPDAPSDLNAVTARGVNAKLIRAVRAQDLVALRQWLFLGATDFHGLAAREAPLGPLRDAFLPINQRDANGANVHLMAAVKAKDLQRVSQLLFLGAFDADGMAAREAPPGALRNAFLPVNKVDANGANALLVAAVRANDPQAVLEARAQGAQDYGRQAFKLAGTLGWSHASRMAFAKVAVSTTATTPTTTTTTSTTATTTTTGIATTGARTIRAASTATRQLRGAVPLQAPPPKPERVAKGWVSRIGGASLSDGAQVEAFMKRVALGEVTPIDAPTAQAVFNDLIQHEAYDVFVDVFTAYQKILALQAQAQGKPFKITLTLQLPRDWKPTDRVALNKAFSRVQAQRLEVLYPQYVKGGGAAGASSDPVPAAVSEVVGVMLKNGASELVVCGELADPGPVADALGRSSTLDGIELGEAGKSESNAATLAGYGALIVAASTRTTLKSLTLHHPETVTKLWDHSRRQARPKWPALASVTLTGGTEATGPAFAWFMGIAAKSKALAEVSLAFADLGVGLHVRAMLMHLKTHRSLTRLQLHNTGYDPQAGESLTCMSQAFELVRSCPRLTHFYWNSGMPVVQGGSAMHNGFRAYAHLLHLPSEEIEAALKDPNLPLKSFSMIGFPLSAGEVSSFCSRLRRNRSIKHVDFSHCSIDIEAVSTPVSIKAIRGRKSFLLPKDPQAYYWMPAETKGVVFGFPPGTASTVTPTSGRPAPIQFAPVPVDGVSVVPALTMKFEQDLMAFAEAIADLPDAPPGVNPSLNTATTTTTTTTATTTTTGNTSATGATPRSPRSGPGTDNS